MENEIRFRSCPFCDNNPDVTMLSMGAYVNGKLEKVPGWSVGCNSEECAVQPHMHVACSKRLAAKYWNGTAADDVLWEDTTGSEPSEIVSISVKVMLKGVSAAEDVSIAGIEYEADTEAGLIALDNQTVHRAQSKDTYEICGSVIPNFADGESFIRFTPNVVSRIFSFPEITLKTSAEDATVVDISFRYDNGLVMSMPTSSFWNTPVTID